MHELLQWAESLAGSPWILVVLFAFCLVDGFFPPFPSETLVIALTTLAMTTGRPTMLPVLAVAALGAWLGDQIAYQIGRSVPVHRLRLFRTRRGAAALSWAERALRHRGASFIIAGRYIPIGRVAVNMTAGAVHYHRRRFMAVAAVAAVTWAAYSALIGVAAASVFGRNPLLAVGAGIVGGVVIGYLVDRVMQRIAGEPAPASSDRGPGTGAAGSQQAPEEPEQTPVV